MKAATDFFWFNGNGNLISIHAAREGGDFAPSNDAFIARAFQSTPPVKAATKSSITSSGIKSFQSTPPVKAATARKKRLTKRK